MFSETKAVILSICHHTGRAEHGIAKPNEGSVVAPRHKVSAPICVVSQRSEEEICLVSFTFFQHRRAGVGTHPDRTWCQCGSFSWVLARPQIENGFCQKGASRRQSRCSWCRGVGGGIEFRMLLRASKPRHGGRVRNRATQPTNELNFGGVRTTGAVVVMTVSPTHQLEVCGHRPDMSLRFCGLCGRCVNSIPHTSHFLMFHSTHCNVTLTLAQIWCVAHLILSFLLFAFHLLSHLLFHFIVLHFLLVGDKNLAHSC